MSKVATKTSTEAPTHCDTCAQPLRQKSGRGSVKSRCNKCIELRSALKKVEALFGEIVFANEDTVSEWRSHFFMMRNVNLSPSSVTVRPCDVTPNDGPRQASKDYKPRKVA